MAIPSYTHQHIVELLSNHLGKNSKAKIVDYGCGSGALLDYLPTRLVQDYTGFEVSSAALIAAKKAFPNHKKYHFYPINQKELPSFGKARSLDAVILVGVWQYLQPFEQTHLLQQAARTLKKSGVLLISCSVDHRLYRWFNLYRHFVPHLYVHRPTILKKVTKAHFSIMYQQEKGLLLNPLFSNIISFFFDAGDRIIFKTRGTIGPLGQKVRSLVYPLLAWENRLTIDYGYTLFLVAKLSNPRVKRRSTKK